MWPICLGRTFCDRLKWPLPGFEGTTLNTQKLILAGVAALGSVAVMPAVRAMPATTGAVIGQTTGLQPAAFFGHHRKIESYCYPRDYWWFYRPYTTAQQGYARCMPYF